MIPELTLDTLMLDLPVFENGPLPFDGDSLISTNLLEGLQPFYDGGFTPHSVPVPRDALLPMAARGQIEDSIRLPARSWLVAFSAGSAQTAGFRFQIFDKGRNAPCLTAQWMDAKCAAMDFTDGDSAIPYVLVRPYCIVPAGKSDWGQLQIRITNLATVTNDCQLLLWFAIPGNPLPGGHQ